MLNNSDIHNRNFLILVNKLFDVLNEEWGNDLAYEFLEEFSIQKKDYRDGNMNGNACKKLLGKLSILKRRVPRKLRKYVEALGAFEKVRQSCFGQDLLPSYRADIQDFREAYEKLNIAMTNKVHVLVDHVADFCEKHQKGLGFFSEQAR